MKTFTSEEFKSYCEKVNTIDHHGIVNNKTRVGSYLKLLFNKDNLARRTDIIFIGIDKENNINIIEQIA